MITPLAMDRFPVFRSIYCPHTRGQCPLHRWQINCLACEIGTPVFEGWHMEGLYETVQKADCGSMFHKKVPSPEVRAVFGPEKPDL